MISDGMTDEEFERHVLAVLRRELGLDGLARFLRVYRAGSGDYTRDRHRWLEGATIRRSWRKSSALANAARDPALRPVSGYAGARIGNISALGWQSCGIWSHVRPSSTRPVRLLNGPPHCLKKNGTLARTH
jgi:hypothetical protein